MKNLNQENQEQTKEYFDAIKASVEDSSYYKDGLDWYFFRYVNPFCERTIFFIAFILTAVLFYYLFNLIQSSYPLVRKVPVILKAVDESEYFPYLTKLYIDKDAQNIDEAVASYLLKKYVINRESHDYSDGEIEPINIKFNQIKNTSSVSEYINFQNFMSKQNPDSPIWDFGKDAYRKVSIESAHFIREDPKTFSDKAKSLLMNIMPTDAEVTYFLDYKHADGTKTQQKFMVKINFTFSGVQRPVNNDNNPVLGFIVNSYKKYTIQ